MKKFNFFYLILFFISFFNCGFSEETKVKKSQEYKLIKYLTFFDKVLSHDVNENFENQFVTRIVSKNIEKYILIEIEDEFFKCALDQKFFIFNKKEWTRAENLKEGDLLFSKSGKLLKIKSIKIIDEPLKIYEIGVHKNHNFLIGKNEVLVHNFAFLVSVCFSFGEGIEFTGIAFGLIAAGVSAVVNWIKEKNGVDVDLSIDKKKYGGYSSDYNDKPKTFSHSDGGGPEDPNDPYNRNKKNKRHGSHGRNRNKNQQKEIDKENQTKDKITKTEFFQKSEIKNSYKHYQGEIYVFKDGSKPIVDGGKYLRWDYTHCEVEVFREKKVHIGAISSENFKFVKPPDPERKI